MHIDHADLGPYKVEGLYIKLDKKLTLEAKQLVVPQTKSSPSFGSVDRTFDQIKYLLNLFETISLEKIDFANDRYTLLYADDVLYITNSIYEIAGNIEREGSKLVATIPLLYIKKEEITIAGELTYDLRTNILTTKGNFDAYEIKGDFSAQKEKNHITYRLKSERFDSLSLLIKRIGLSPAIEAWVLQKVKAKQYRLAYLTGAVDVKGEKVDPLPNSIKGLLYFDDVTIKYHPKLPAASADRLALGFEKGDLTFTLSNPTYEGREINGTSVLIRHVVGEESPFLVLDLHMRTPVDDVVQRVLHTYHLTIPVTHDAKDKIAVWLKIPLGKTKGTIKTKVDATLTHGLLQIDGLPLWVEKGRVAYRSGVVKIKNVTLKSPYYKGDVTGDVLLKKAQANLKLDLSHITLGKKSSPLFQMKNRSLSLHLDYNNNVTVSLPQLTTTITRQKAKLSVAIASLEKLIPYLPQAPSLLKGGTLKLENNAKESYHFSGTLQLNEGLLCEKKVKECYKEIPFRGDLNVPKEKSRLYALNDRFSIDLKKGLIKLTKLDINLKVLLKHLKKEGQGSKSSQLFGKKFVVLGEKSALRYPPYKLLLDNYDIEIAPNGNIKAFGSLDGDVVKFTKKGAILSIEALRVKDKLLHPLINFKGLKGGRYSLKKEGDPTKTMKGRIIIEKGVLSDFTAYNNTLAFLNTIPALATLNSPGFSSKGFKIKEGVIEYTMTPQKIIFTSVYLEGTSATIVGKGEMLLMSKKLNIDLAIQSAKEWSNTLGKIPILGYILMGDDKRMTIGLKITGTLEKPEVNSSVAKDILTLPLEFIKRTIKAPVKLLQE